MTATPVTTGRTGPLRLADIAPDVLQDLAIRNGVCVRPVLSRMTDATTGETSVVPIPCGSTQARKCPPCAERNRRLRMQQCREGWHRVDLTADDPGDLDDGDELDQADESGRRVRSTRRRQDVPDLPLVAMAQTTVGKTFTAPNGRTYRPSMFLTLTLPSYGRVHRDGTPLDPDSYNYHRAALDALHFPTLVDRFWQNLRRCAGYKVQYFAAVEAQHRLAHTCTPPSAAWSRAPSRGRSPPPPTTNCGGRNATGPSTSAGTCRCGTSLPAATSTRPPASCSRGGMRL